MTHEGLPPDYPFQRDWEVTPRELKRMIDSGTAPALIDCRTPAERDIATIAGSVHVPMAELSGRLGELRRLEDEPVVVYCHHGARSLRVTAALREAGFSDVRSLAGGIHLWSTDIDPSVPIY